MLFYSKVVVIYIYILDTQKLGVLQRLYSIYIIRESDVNLREYTQTL